MGLLLNFFGQFSPVRRQQVILLTPPTVRRNRSEYGFVPIISRLEPPKSPVIIGHETPMVRVQYEDGSHSKWHMYLRSPRHGNIEAIEIVAFDPYQIIQTARLKVG